MRWEDVLKKDVEELGGGSDWKTRAADREGWKARCFTGCRMPQTPKNK